MNFDFSYQELLLAAGGVCLAGLWLRRYFPWEYYQAEIRLSRIVRDLKFPASVDQKLRESYPHLNDKNIAKIRDALREYFYLCQDAGKSELAMPSRVAGVAWQGFIDAGGEYEVFCQQAFGRLLPYSKAEGLFPSEKTQNQIRLRRTWNRACAFYDLPADDPVILPDLFALDRDLAIPDGFHYSLDEYDKKGRKIEKIEDMPFGFVKD
ncbi:hypothetical protein O4H49_02665 [Kiloniella laminariae]|uniref:Uncharacterized protein n=1 Tax=Kiloniella laminariae TaxID=454162 RepID=A0ABT4LEY8_9PROT|nr:hypothetical protein [Kiloniella laminariae]MCZ4279664.1 hypothetical protein [Kiloniella laminariae]